MKALFIALAAAGVLASTGAASAPPMEVQHYAQDKPYAQDNWYDRNASINEREARIAERIQHGLNYGRITKREARRLSSELNAIEHKERQYNSDGRLSRRETEDLNRDLNRLADHVRQQARDEERRY